jgi:hypothetical protein
MLCNLRYPHKGDMCKDYVGNYQRQTILFWTKTRGIRLWGHHYQFSILCLKSITDGVRNALPIQRATFPKQWMTASVLDQAHNACKAPFPNHVPTVPPQAGWHSVSSTPQEQAQGQQRLQKHAIKEDICHQKMRLLMDHYLAWYNNYIGLSAILTASGKRNPCHSVAHQQGHN